MQKKWSGVQNQTSGPWEDWLQLLSCRMCCAAVFSTVSRGCCPKDESNSLWWTPLLHSSDQSSRLIRWWTERNSWLRLEHSSASWLSSTTFPSCASTRYFSEPLLSMVVCYFPWFYRFFEFPGVWPDWFRASEGQGSHSGQHPHDPCPGSRLGHHGLHTLDAHPIPSASALHPEGHKQHTWQRSIRSERQVDGGPLLALPAQHDLSLHHWRGGGERSPLRPAVLVCISGVVFQCVSSLYTGLTSCFVSFALALRLRSPVHWPSARNWMITDFAGVHCDWKRC